MARFALEAFRKLLAGNLDRDNTVESRVSRLVDFTHAAGADRRDDFVGSEAVSRLHGAGAPFMSSAGQVTITVSGCEACSWPVSERKRWPSRVASYRLAKPSRLDEEDFRTLDE